MLDGSWAYRKNGQKSIVCKSLIFWLHSSRDIQISNFQIPVFIPYSVYKLRKCKDIKVGSSYHCVNTFHGLWNEWRKTCSIRLTFLLYSSSSESFFVKGIQEKISFYCAEILFVCFLKDLTHEQKYFPFTTHCGQTGKRKQSYIWEEKNQLSLWQSCGQARYTTCLWRWNAPKLVESNFFFRSNFAE